MENILIKQGLTTAKSSTERTNEGISIPTGATYEDTDSSNRVRRFVYLRNVSGATLAVGDCLVAGDEEGVTTPATATIGARMPMYVAMAIMADDDYGWFQVEGVATVKVTANASGAAIADGSWLVMVNSVRTLAVDATVYKGHALAMEAATAAGSISALLPYTAG